MYANIEGMCFSEWERGNLVQTYEVRSNYEASHDGHVAGTEQS